MQLSGAGRPESRRQGLMIADPLKRRVRAQYDQLAEAYDHRWDRYVRASNEATLERVQLRPGEQLLDVGCGTGALLARLAERQPAAKVVGIDLSPAMAAQARARLPRTVHVTTGDAEFLPFPAQSFDVVVSASSFHYWPTPARGLEELRRVLQPGGRLVLTDWCDEYLACRVCDRLLRWVDPAHGRIYGRRECGALLRAAHYDVTDLERYRISWLWGLMTASARRPAA
jgi:ubiquinone/menaquinone biosynthesis C-methylase UbiE